jgi:hypothetical protein
VTDHWDPMSFGRSAIEPHDQNRASREWGLIVDVARDLLDWAVEHRPILAQNTIDAWLSAKPPLLKRLAIYGTAKRTDLSPDDALALFERHGWLYERSLKHEVFQLLERVFSKSSESAQRQFIAHSMAVGASEENNDSAQDNKPIAAYERYNLAVWLRRISPESNVAAKHLDAIQGANPDFGPRDHPDLDIWISTGFRGPRSPLSAEELVGKGVADAVSYLIEYRPHGRRFDQPDRGGLLSVFEKAVSQHLDWALHIAAELVSRKQWEADLWNSLLNSWRGAELDRWRWRSVIELIDANLEIVNSAPMAVADLLDSSIRRKDLEPNDVDTLELIGDRVVATADEPASVEADDATDWSTKAINDPVGQVGLMLVRALSYRMDKAGDDWAGLPDVQRERFESLLASGGNNAAMARVTLAGHVHFLFHADRLWTKTQILPLFDWAAEPIVAAQAWDGFLTWGHWKDALFKEMEPFVRQVFAHADDLRADTFVTNLARVAALRPHDPWRDNGWLFDFVRVLGPQHLAKWTEQFGRYAESLSAEGRQELWVRWVATYWDDRITGVPQPLSDKERQAMVSWIMPFRHHAAELVGRIAIAPPQQIDHYTFYRLKRSGLAVSHANEMGKLLRYLLHAAQAIDHDNGQLLTLATDALKSGATKDDLLAVASEMARLGVQGAGRLKAKVEAG